MWKHCCAFVCVLGALVLITSTMATAADDPSTLPLIQFTDLIYAGAFRLPDALVNGDGFSIGGRPVAFNPARNSLFIGSRSGRLAEIAIPTPVNSTNLAALPFATFLQGFSDPTEGNLWQIASDGASIDGVMVLGDHLYGSASIYYDANNTQRVSHYARSTDLSRLSFQGMTQVWNDQKAGFVSGYLATVPAEWQAKLGGPAVTGQCCLPITWRTSWGPAIFAWNPANIGVVNPVPATPLVYYPQEHPSLGPWDGSGPTYGGTTQINGVVLIAGTRTALFFGRNGTGPFCYGNGTSVQSLVGTIGPDQEIYCYDPSSPAKGQHAYPYNYQVWAYDLNDLAAVKAGTRQPWDVRPYGVWPFAFPTSEPTVRIGGVGYDPARQIIYVSQLLADQDGYGYRPIIHALKIGGVTGTPLPGPDPTSPTAITPPPSSKATAVTITADKAAPQAPGATINWTAVPAGGVAPYQYKWWTFDGSSWVAVTSWATSSALAWTPSTANTADRVAVWVRSAGNTVDDQEASTAVSFAISGTAAPAPAPAPAPTSRATAATLTADRVAPQPPATTITWSASPSGGVAPYQYKWWTFDGSSWVAVSNWTTSRTFAWTPATANANYRVAVWVRSAGNTVDDQETSTAVSFAISGTAATTPPPTTPTARVSAVTLSPDLIAPQPPGTTINWTAAAAGGVAPYQYKWWTFDGSAWVAVGAWTTQHTLAWTPATANASNRVAVWVRSAGNSVDDQEVSTAVSFAISGTTTTTPPPDPTTPPTTSPSSSVSAVALSANRPAPQPAGTTTVFAAVPAGGVAPHEYKWWVYDGTSWALSGAWTTANTFAWTPAGINPLFKIAVWVRSAGSTIDAPESKAEMAFPTSTSAASTTSARVTAVGLAANKTAPQATGAAITWTATPTGGVAPHQYKFLLWDSSTWIVVRGWSSTNTFSWTPAAANQYYKMAVWVRSATNTVDESEATTAVPFAITSGTMTTTTARVTAVTISANRIAPQTVGATTTFAALPSGGTGTLQYKWWLYDGTTWVVTGGWTTSSLFAWTPQVPNANLKIGVWVKSGTNGVDEGEATSSISFPIQ
ncbi:MAG: hypothetical protein ABI665_17685 [Vicinamibacterales bacterium]